MWSCSVWVVTPALSFLAVCLEQLLNLSLPLEEVIRCKFSLWLLNNRTTSQAIGGITLSIGCVPVLPPRVGQDSRKRLVTSVSGLPAGTQL